MPHLYIAVTAHGYGHLAQVAPIVHALRARIPTLRVTLQGTVTPAFAAGRLPPGFRHRQEAGDVALPMDGPLRVRWQEGLALYAAFDAAHEHHLTQQRDWLVADPPDLVLADVPWVPLMAASELGLPAVALCSFSWLDILLESPVRPLVPSALIERMRGAYAGAELFLRPCPSMPMAWLPNGCDIGPIARPRPRAPAAICRRLGLAPDTRLVLVQFGGTGELSLEGLEPLPEDVQLVTPDAQSAAGHDRVSLIGGPGLAVPDVLACCDVIVTKPGYGTFAEAACHGIPVLYVPRYDWPEERPLVDWLRKQVPTLAIPEEALIRGRLAEPLRELLAAGTVPAVPATGVEDAVERLAPFLS